MKNSELKVGDILFEVRCDKVYPVEISKVSIKDNCVSVKVLKNKSYDEVKYRLSVGESSFLYGHKNGNCLINDINRFYTDRRRAEQVAKEYRNAYKWDHLIYTRKEMADINKEIDELCQK